MIHIYSHYSEKCLLYGLSCYDRDDNLGFLRKCPIFLPYKNKTLLRGVILWWPLPPT